MPRHRFGRFDFDTETGQLSRDGVPVRLQGQPAQILAVLVTNAGEVVTRESLRKSVWGTETHVDFDAGLNFCIAQIRTALGDSADSPVYIKTVPKRGYQFIAPVAKDSPPAVSDVSDVPATPGRTRRVVFATAAAVFLLGGGAYWLLARPTHASPRVAVTRFDNQTGDIALDRFADNLTDAVVVELTAAGAGRFSVIGNAALLRRPRDFRDLNKIRGELGAAYVVVAQVQPEKVLVHLIRLPEQTHVTVVRTEASRNAGEIADRVARQFAPYIR